MGADLVQKTEGIGDTLTLQSSSPPPSATHKVSLGLNRYYWPLPVHEQTLKYEKTDSVSLLEAYGSFRFFSIFNSRWPGAGLRYTRSFGSEWAWILSAEYLKIWSLEFGLLRRFQAEQECTLLWGLNAGDTYGSLSQNYRVGEQNIRMSVGGTRFTGQYTLRPDRNWQLHLHMLRNTSAQDYLFGILYKTRLFRKKIGIQFTWHDLPGSLYGTLVYFGDTWQWAAYGMHTETLGWSSGFSIAFSRRRSAPAITSKRRLP